MSLPLPFSEDHRDCLQEISNVAMGTSGEAMALLTKQFVMLSIPVIRCIAPESVTEAMASLQGYDRISGIAESFDIGGIEGAALLMITEPSFNDLSEFTGRKVSDDSVAFSLMQELSHVVSTTCLKRLAEQLEEPLLLQPEKMAAMNIELQDFSLLNLQLPGFCDPSKSESDYNHMVSVEINFHLEDHPFNCDLLLLIPESSVSNLVSHLDKFL